MEIKIISYRMMLNNVVNCYLISTEGSYFLIDTGMPNRRLQIQKDIENAGCHQGDLKFIILTHGDVDLAVMLPIFVSNLVPKLLCMWRILIWSKREICLPVENMPAL